jgi:hypothetical protein
VLRVRHRPECDAAVADQTSRWPTAELDDRLAAAGVHGVDRHDAVGRLDRFAGFAPGETAGELDRPPLSHPGQERQRCLAAK